ncbi:MAG TPA: VIT family protein [Steroidobacteraceae bacterium]|nr:VIT family protein [Steroidobacteraceae bacterium]
MTRAVSVSGHGEAHAAARSGWLRAGVLGANDGLISTSSLIIGVSAAQLSDAAVFMAGLAGLVGGALSMAAGEFVSVSSQADSERADLARERLELATEPEAEHRELVGLFMQRGLTRPTAEQAAREVEAVDVLAAHARLELGISEETRARPAQAALSSMGSFAFGAAVPLALFSLVPIAARGLTMPLASLLLLMLLGALAARLGRAPLLRAALRVGFWGIAAMGVTALAGRLFHTGVL